MIFQCSRCRALSAATEAEIDRDRAGLRCACCGVVTWLPGAGKREEAGSSPSASAVLPPPPATAVAGPPREEAAAALPVDVRERARAALPAPAPGEEELDAAFRQLLDAWHDEQAHGRLLRQASVQDRLALLGARYRVVRTLVPDDAAACRAQEEILRLAMARMASMAGTKEVPQAAQGRAMGRLRTAALLIGGLAALWLILLFFLRAPG